MSLVYRLSCPQPKLSGTIILESSKSISNRVLIIQSLCKEPFQINRLSKSDDTNVLVRMLSSDKDVLFSGHAGSSFRFMLARLCLGNKEVTLDATEQLRRRPIGPLVKALQTLGADISYVTKEGFPPLLIKPVKGLGENVHEVSLQAGVSSQYVSALLMIAPLLPHGLKLHLIDDPVSLPYILMTLEIMKWFGAGYEWNGNTITVPHGEYVGRDFTVEGDWSAAGYYYSIAALAPEAEIQIEGLNEESLQGDAVVKEIFSLLGVETSFHANGMLIKKVGMKERPKEVRYDFLKSPDIAQTVMVALAGLGVKGILSGLKTLKIKETDRNTAMQTELAKVKAKVEVKEENDDITCIVTGRVKWKDKAKFDTYEDHRMAMSLAPLACISPVIIRDPDVVSKSYPGFWKDLEKIGMKVEFVKGKR